MKNNIVLMSLGAIFIGFSPIVTKSLTLPPTLIAFYRFFLGMICIFIYMKIKGHSLKLNEVKHSLPFFALSGLFFSVDLWLWHRSIIYIGAGIATLLANTQVFYLVIYDRLVYKSRLRWTFYPGLLLALIGITLSSLKFISFDQIDQNMMGIIYGLLTGVSYAFVTVFMRKGVENFKGEGSFPIFAITSFSALISFIFSLFEGNFSVVTDSSLFYLFVYGGIIHFGGWFLITKAIGNISLSIASLLLLLQPICASIFGNIFFGEALGINEILYLGISLLGIYLASSARAR